MTCIVGIAHKGMIHMGGDSCGSDGSWQEVLNPKVFIVDDRFLIGCTTSFRMIDLLRFELEVDIQSPNQSDDEFMRTTFIHAVRECFKEGGWMENSSEKNEGGNFLVGYQGTLYEVQDDFSVLNSKDCMAIGSGSLPARGSLYTSKEDPNIPRRITLALEAAEATITSVRGPFVQLQHGAAK